jgi:hypothetical protein
VGDRGVVNIDGVFLAKILEDGAGKSFSQVGDDPIGHAEAMLDVSDEFDGVGGWVFVNRSAPTSWSAVTALPSMTRQGTGVVDALQGFPPIATNPLGNTTISVAIGGYYCTEMVIWLQFVCLMQHKI